MNSTSNNTNMDENKRKLLIKRLHKIKMKKARANSSFMDVYSFYESKLNKIKNNNQSLAKALAEQRQVSQSWYDECVTLKGELQESNEKILNYEFMENGDLCAVVEAETEKRLKLVTQPLDLALKSTLEDVARLLDSLTKLKQLTGSLIKSPGKEKTPLAYYSRNSIGSSGFRAPLTRTPKSPRKNVVHPMVEGHVLQPFMINIPRMTLEDRYRYHLEERMESQKDNHRNMSLIDEYSASEVESSSDNQLADSQENVSGDEAISPVEQEETTSTESPSQVAISSLNNTSPETECVTGTSEPSEPLEDDFSQLIKIGNELSPPKLRPSRKCKNKEKPEDKKTKIKSQGQKSKKKSLESTNENGSDKLVNKEEDPLEGPSWLHCNKRKKGGRKRPRQNGPKMHIIDNSSDSDDYEDVQRGFSILPKKLPGIYIRESPPNKTKSLYIRPSPPSDKVALVNVHSSPPRNKNSQPNGSSPFSKKKDVILDSEVDASSCIDQSSLSSLLSLESEQTNILNELTMKVSRRSNRNSKDKNNDKEYKQRCLESFIINETLNPSFDGLNPTEDNKSNLFNLGSNESIATNNVTSLPHEERKICDVTTLLNTSMEITECLPKDLMGLNSKKGDEKDKENCEIDRKPKKFFKSKDGCNYPVNTIIHSLAEKTPFDMSQIEASFHNFNLIKENIPPNLVNNQGGEEEENLKLRSLSVVVKDIMKSPQPVTPINLAQTVTPKVNEDLNSKRISKAATTCGPLTSELSTTRIKINKRTKSSSPYRKTSKKRKNLTFNLKQQKSDANKKKKGNSKMERKNSLVDEENKRERKNSLVDEENKPERKNSLVDEEKKPERKNSLVDKEKKRQTTLVELELVDEKKLFHFPNEEESKEKCDNILLNYIKNQNLESEINKSNDLEENKNDDIVIIEKDPLSLDDVFNDPLNCEEFKVVSKSTSKSKIDKIKSVLTSNSKKNKCRDISSKGDTLDNKNSSFCGFNDTDEKFLPVEFEGFTLTESRKRSILDDGKDNFHLLPKILRVEEEKYHLINSCDSKDSTTVAHTLDPVGCISSTEDVKELENQIAHPKRRAASKITSLKEPSLNCKMRRDEGKNTKKSKLKKK